MCGTKSLNCKGFHGHIAGIARGLQEHVKNCIDFLRSQEEWQNNHVAGKTNGRKEGREGKGREWRGGGGGVVVVVFLTLSFTVWVSVQSPARMHRIMGAMSVWSVQGPKKYTQARAWHEDTRAQTTKCVSEIPAHIAVSAQQLAPRNRSSPSRRKCWNSSKCHRRLTHDTGRGCQVQGHVEIMSRFSGENSASASLKKMRE